MSCIEKEYIIFCDESEKVGKYYSNFYGGLIVGGSQYQRITQVLNDKKNELNLKNEIKWERVTSQYLSKYQEMILCLFNEIRKGNLKIRIMFSQNAREPVSLTPGQVELSYFLLYYQFLKHGFGLIFRNPSEGSIRLRLYFDQFPDTQEKIHQFKGYLSGLNHNPDFKTANIQIEESHITEVNSKDHVLLQCLDIILGSICFRLNDKHKEKIPGKWIRGKRTRAKETLYKTILGEIRKIHRNFNIGISTGAGSDPEDKWKDPYLHWCFVPKNSKYKPELTKSKK